MGLRKIEVKVSMWIPDGYDGVWDADPTGVQAAHDLLISTLSEHALDRLQASIQLEEKDGASEADRALAAAYRVEHTALRTLKVMPMPMNQGAVVER